MEKMVWFDMDGTIADFYAVNGWLADLEAENTRPYEVCKPLVNMSRLARRIHKAQQNGVKVGIISWTSKTGSESYNKAVAVAKNEWLAKHLPSVEWDSIKVVNYGTDKLLATGGGILFDDEERNRSNWGKGAYTPDEIFNIL